MMRNDKLIERIIDQVSDLLYEISNSQSELREGPGKWSKKQELGHLIDSAINNRRRFVMSQYQSNMIFDGYDQVKWVNISGYDLWVWKDIVDSWILRNSELSRILSRLSGDTLFKMHGEHNLQDVAFKKVQAHEKVSLDFFIKDYIYHMEHHLKRIVPDYDRLLLDY